MIEIFTAEGSEALKKRINQLNPNSKAKWGTMNVSQMLAHCNIAFKMIYEDKHKRPGKLKQFFLKLLIKPIVVSAKPYTKNGRTAPEFIVSSSKDFETEKTRLLQYIDKTQSLGALHFEGKDSHSFGTLSATEWNIMLVKHLEHHLKQFDV